jgi:hypothetical protein
LLHVRQGRDRFRIIALQYCRRRHRLRVGFEQRRRGNGRRIRIDRGLTGIVLQPGLLGDQVFVRKFFLFGVLEITVVQLTVDRIRRALAMCASLTSAPHDLCELVDRSLDLTGAKRVARGVGGFDRAPEPHQRVGSRPALPFDLASLQRPNDVVVVVSIGLGIREILRCRHELYPQTKGV